MEENLMYQKLHEVLANYADLADKRVDEKQNEIIARVDRKEGVSHTERYESLAKDKRELEEEISSYESNGRSYVEEPRELQEVRMELEKVENELSHTVGQEIQQARNELSKLENFSKTIKDDLAKVDDFLEFKSRYEEEAKNMQEDLKGMLEEIKQVRQASKILARKEVGNKEKSPELIRLEEEYIRLDRNIQEYRNNYAKVTAELSSAEVEVKGLCEKYEISKKLEQDQKKTKEPKPTQEQSENNTTQGTNKPQEPIDLPKDLPFTEAQEPQQGEDEENENQEQDDNQQIDTTPYDKYVNRLKDVLKKPKEEIGMIDEIFLGSHMRKIRFEYIPKKEYIPLNLNERNVPLTDSMIAELEDIANQIEQKLKELEENRENQSKENEQDSQQQEEQQDNETNYSPLDFSFEDLGQNQQQGEQENNSDTQPNTMQEATASSSSTPAQKEENEQSSSGNAGYETFFNKTESQQQSESTQEAKAENEQGEEERLSFWGAVVVSHMEAPINSINRSLGQKMKPEERHMQNLAKGIEEAKLEIERAKSEEGRLTDFDISTIEQFIKQGEDLIKQVENKYNKPEKLTLKDKISAFVNNFHPIQAIKNFFGNIKQKVSQLTQKLFPKKEETARLGTGKNKQSETKVNKAVEYTKKRDEFMKGIESKTSETVARTENQNGTVTPDRETQDFVASVVQDESGAREPGE